MLTSLNPLPSAGLQLQMQCYQCEEFVLNNDCSLPRFIVNCTANIQNGCQKEVMVQRNGVLYRKSCASLSSCLITSAGYHPFCSPGKVGSICISCCDTPLCNGPRLPRNSSPSPALPALWGLHTTSLTFLYVLLLCSWGA
nr:PREDICTED: ly6/PLAUR domain-containing protein 1-like [Latimeria chalumnae]|eukprot:XP_005986402.1 PREDICTED: ly6/PLAUR domain-containing protein 1-like [Latimeria chalumnae]